MAYTPSIGKGARGGQQLGFPRVVKIGSVDVVDHATDGSRTKHRGCRDLPKGTWLHMSHWPPETTEEDIVNILHDRGLLLVTPEQLSVKRHGDFASVILSLDSESVCWLLRWALQDLQPVPGREFRISPTGNPNTPWLKKKKKKKKKKK